MKWSKYQRAVFKNVASGEGHTIVEAVAGSGKTTSLLESLNHIPEGKTWLLVAFNKRIANELKNRAPDSFLGDIRTLHSLGLKTIYQRFPNVKVDNDKMKYILNKLVGKDKKLWDLKFAINKTVGLCKGYLVDGAEFIDHIMDNHEIDTCEIDRDQFISYVQKAMDASREEMRSIDFNDMIWINYVYNLPVQKYDRVFIDECQDLNNGQIALALKAVKKTGRILALGDRKQCVDASTSVQTPSGLMTVGDLLVDDEVLSYHNGKNVFRRVLTKTPSGWESGLEIETKSGKKLLMSPDHKIWACLPTLGEEQYIVYLMYSSKFGFRIGKTNKLKDKANPFGNRTRCEQADKLWVIGIYDSNEEAILEEESLSLEFGIPKTVFNGTNRGLNQDRINTLFLRHGDNGLKLLSERNLTFEQSHWTGRSATDSNNKSTRRRVNIRSHINKNYSRVSFEWTDVEISAKLFKAGIPYTKGSNKRGNSNLRLRRCFSNYRDAQVFANKVAIITRSFLVERLSFEGKRPQLMTASGLFKGSSVLVNRGDGIELDEIISINTKSGTFIDIGVDGTANFFGNDVLSHNCLYAFAGASLYSMDNIKKKLKAKELPLSITYRCPNLVVKEAQKFAPQIKAAPGAPDGLVEAITRGQMVKQAKPGCFILSRANAPLIGLALGFIRNSIPAVIQGRDIGQNLLNLIRKSRKKTLHSFMTWLDGWEKRESARLRKKKANPGLIKDKAACMRALADACHDLKDVKNKIKILFEDTDELGKIVLSTVHKSKGLERDIVYMLIPTFKTHTQEERNIYYVSVTRSARELYLVN